MEKAGDYQRGYLAGYRDGLAAAQQGRVQLPAVLQQPIEVLGLPVRPLNCLRAYDCRLVEDVAGLPAETIRRMRNLGKRSAECAIWENDPPMKSPGHSIALKFSAQCGMPFCCNPTGGV